MEKFVGVGDMKISKTASDIIVANSLGSGIAVVVYDPLVNVGGILRYILPNSLKFKEGSLKNYFIYADKAIPDFFSNMYDMECQHDSMKICVVGGAYVLAKNEIDNLGEQNYLVLKKYFKENHLNIDKTNIGSKLNLSVRLVLQTGNVFIKSPGLKEEKL